MDFPSAAQETSPAALRAELCGAGVDASVGCHSPDPGTREPRSSKLS